MLPTFVIGLREGVEAALIVGIIAAFLAKDPRGRHAMSWMWLGVAAAIGLCVVVGVTLELVNRELPHREQEGLETIIAGLAVGAVTFMIVWMRANARGLSKHLRADAGAALAAGSTGALVAMAFFAVIREGLETVVFLLAAFQSTTNPGSAGVGAVLGVTAAVGIGVAIYRGGVKLNLGRFFRVTGVVLVFVAAGLVASALHTAHEAGWLHAGQQHALDLSWLVVQGTWTAALLTGMLGLRPFPAIIEVAGYAIYALPMLVFLLLPDRRRPRPRRSALRGASTATLAVLLAGLLLTACGDSDDDGAKPARADASAVATTYADLVLAAYDASIASTEKMRQSIDAFLAKPSEARLAAARKAWVAARDDYIVTEPFRFYGGPIDDPKTGPEGKINAWPMDEAYVDYVVGNPKAGIVNDTKGYPKVTADVIVKANERGGETNISSGWHAIEFLLWGQDRSKSGPGARPASDYTTARNAQRRADYLRLTTKQLLADLERVRDQWATRGGEFRTSFLADPDRAVRRMMRGIGALAVGELAGERMAVAFESADQEDEHSCFSDNTNADVVNDIKGIRMVYGADFPGIFGPSLERLVKERDPELAGELRSEIEDALAKAQAFPATFETMIAAADGSAERKAMEAVIDRLEDFGETLGEAADELRVKVGFGV